MLISLIIWLVILGVVFYFLESIPMDPTFKTGIRIVAILIVLLVILNAFGVMPLSASVVR